MVQFTQPSAKLQPDQLLHIASLIQQQLGLIYNGDKLKDLERRLKHVLKSIPQEKLKTAVSHLLAGQFDQVPNLINQLTIPETYFLRNIRLFMALKSTVLPEIIERKKYSRQVNIWSAGCSSGEEPYSIAILLHELLGERINQWKINLIATDLNEKILEKARSAIYSEWSFRGVPPDFKVRYFIPLSNGRYQLNPHIRQTVKFKRHNLIKGPYPPVTSVSTFDIILCRNVLIYMSHSTAQIILEKFYRILDNQGYFITGPSEFPSLKSKKFQPLMLQGTIIYQKSLNHHPVTSKIKSNSVKNRFPKTTQARTAARHQPAIHEKKARLPLEFKKKDEKKEKNKMTVPDELSLVRELADKGNLKEALELCQQYLKRRSTDKNGYYLLGTIYMEQGELDKAETNFQRAIYFDPDFAMAHFTLANIYSMTNRNAEAQKCFRNVLKILKSCDPSATVPESGGMLVSHFTEMIKKLVNVQ